MKYQVKEFINEKYAKAVNILKDNLKEHYHVFYGLRLSENGRSCLLNELMMSSAVSPTIHM